MPQLAVLAAWMATPEAKSTQCPQPESIPGCPCYNFEDGLFLECAGATEESLKVALTGVINVAGPEGMKKKYKISKPVLTLFYAVNIIIQFDLNGIGIRGDSDI
ncbi:hypothetical protein PV325_005232 [Microctonus aethiopoides]|nr:hypothetical protein PV325_005232 [Microctonus aethiopoides]